MLRRFLRWLDPRGAERADQVETDKNRQLLNLLDKALEKRPGDERIRAQYERIQSLDGGTHEH